MNWSEDCVFCLDQQKEILNAIGHGFKVLVHNKEKTDFCLYFKKEESIACLCGKYGFLFDTEFLDSIIKYIWKISGVSKEKRGASIFGVSDNCEKSVEKITLYETISKGKRKKGGLLNYDKIENIYFDFRMKNIKHRLLSNGEIYFFSCVQKDITGLHRGEIEVLEPTYKNHYGSTLWTCRCACGNIFEFPQGRFCLDNKNYYLDCGCGISIWKNEIGKKYGKLTVVSYEGTNKFQKRQFRCMCECGNETITTLNGLHSGNARSCGCIKSRGEEKIAHFLIKNGILFEKEFSFSDCKREGSPRLLKFDFAIFNEDKSIRCLIEFDGRQHEFGPDGTTWSRDEKFCNLQYIRENDKIKDDYCEKNNISLYRISYKDMGKINNILEDIFYG